MTTFVIMGAPAENKYSVLLVLASFIVCLSAFQSSGEKVSAHDPDTLRFIIPANFPKPIFDFRKNRLTSGGFLLGKALFHDSRLSSDGTVSCASCHQASAAFANLGQALSTGVQQCRGTRSAPPLFNMAWQKHFMWDGRVSTLDQAPLNALSNPCEMDMNRDIVLQVLRKDQNYPAMFARAYGSPEITEKKMLQAFTQFMVMMVSASSKYDRHSRGEPGGEFTAEERAGYQLFKQKCSTCHTEPLFTDDSYRNNGLDKISADSGRDSLTHRRSDKGKFHVPSLRNVEMTRPYMHDGRFRSLKEVLQHYSKGVQPHANLDPVLKRGVPMSDFEQQQLLAFLKTLTDVNLINDQRFLNH